MAMESIDAVAVTQFSDRVHVAAQQSKARLRPHVEIIPMKGESFAYDGIGTAEATELVGRHQPVVFSDIEHKRRKIARRRFVLTLPIDAADARGILLNPQSQYANACARAMERVFDRIVVESMFADVLTGREMGTTVTYANDGGVTVTATAGLTYAKLVEINKNFIDREVGNENAEQLVMGITGDEDSALLQETELVSGDFSRAYAAEKGRMMQAAGINMIHFAGAVARPILDVTAGVRTSFVMCSKRAIVVGMSKEMSVKVDNRPDLVETTQVQIIFDLGAVRTEGVLIEKVTTTD